MEREICRLLKLVEMKKKQYDQACLACSSLLQPWPRSLPAEEECQELCKDENSASSTLDPREEADVKLINDLLSKAQVTRSKLGKNFKQPGIRHLQHQTVLQKPEKAFDDCVVDTLGNAGKSEPQPSQSPAKSENILPAQSTRPSILIKDNPISKQKAGQDREMKEQSSLSAASSKLRKPIKDFVSLKQSKSFDDKSSLQKMTALPASGRSFVKPAHYTAPFKTDPNLPVPKRRQLQKSAIRAPAAKKISLHRNVEKRPAKSVRSKTGTLCDTDLCENASLINRVGNNERCDQESGVNDGDSHQRNVADEETKESFKSLGNIDSSASDVQKPTDSAALGEAAGNQKQFTLQSDGLSINISGNLKKAFARNHELQTRLYERKVYPKASTAKLNFICKLERKFNGDEEMVSRHRAWHCCYAFKRLEILLEDLRLDHFTESSSAEEVLRTKLITEFILSSFAELSEEADIISKVHFKQKDDGSTNTVPPSSRQLEKLSSPPHIWLPAELHDLVCLPRTSLLQYSSISELCQYLENVFELQNTTLQIHLTKLAMSDILPLLESMDPQEPDFPIALRGVYALLSSNGQHFPTFVGNESS